MTTTYTVAHHKGGVGKTALAAELAWRLAQDGRHVLAVDLDQQGQLGARLGIDSTVELRGTLSDVLRADATVDQAATPSPHSDRIRVLHGTSDLKDAERDVDDVVTALRDTLPQAVDEGTDVVIDTPGDIGDLLLCGLAATHVRAPALPRGRARRRDRDRCSPAPGASPEPPASACASTGSCPRCTTPPTPTAARPSRN